MNIIFRKVKGFPNWIYRKMQILLRRHIPDSQVEKVDIPYHVISLPGYELTDEQIKGSRAARKMPSFKVEPGTSLIYGEGHHGT